MRAVLSFGCHIIAGGIQACLSPSETFINQLEEISLKNIFKIIAQAFLLWVIYYLSTWVVKYFHIPLPGSVLGMIVLFTMLSAGAIKEQWLTAAAAPMLKHLTFFFIPIAVELMEWGDLFRQKGHLLFLPLVISTLVALAVTGGIVQLMMKSKHDKNGVN